MKKNWKVILPILIVVALATLIVLRVSGKPEIATSYQRTPLVNVEKPVLQSMALQWQYNGNVSPIQQANIFSKVSGNIENIYVDIGTVVKKNQLLAVIDSTELYQQVLQSAANFENARLNYERTKQLLEQNLVAKEDLDNALTSMKVAEANHALAKTTLGYARITAPFAGIITRRFLVPGALLSPANSNLFMLMDIGTVKVVINVQEKDVPRIPQLKKATITVDALPGQEFSGEIARYSNAIDLDTRTMPVEIDIPNKDQVLKPGMFATVDLVAEEHPNAISIPIEAVSKDDKGTYIFVVLKDIARKRYVTIGIQENFRAEISSGLEANEMVVTAGQQFVKDGVTVRIQKQTS